MSVKPLEYPQTREDESAEDNYYGTIVKDPYHWLEDDRSKETAEWVTQQNNLTSSYLDQIPFRSQIHKKLLDAWNYERYGSPFTEGDYIYWYKNDGLQNQSVVYRKQKDDVDNKTEEIFLDPNTMSEKGTSSLSSLSFTKDGSIACYYISHAGSDINVGYFVDTKTNKLIEEKALDNIKFSGASFYKNEGLFYSRYDYKEGESVLTAMTDSHRVYYHKIGTPQSEDKYIFGHKDDQKRRYVGASVDHHDFKYLLTTGAQTTSGNEIWVKQLTDENVSNDDGLVFLQSDGSKDWDEVDLIGDTLYIITNWAAPNKQLLAIDLQKFLQLSGTKLGEDGKPITNFTEIPECYRVVIKEDQDAVLSVSTAGKYLIANYQRLAISHPVQLTMEGEKVRDITLPGIGSAGGFDAKRHETICYYGYTSYTNPNTIFKYDLETGESTLHFAPKINVEGLNECVSKQVFYKSKDGTEVPMIITYNPNKVDLTSGNNPTMLYGYGGFNISLSPAFSIPTAIWLGLGGIYAVPNIRGGGEKGKKWHIAGTQFQKQNVFDDFCAAAEYLITNKFTTTKNLAIRGGSNGGLLVGACLTQRPDLFAVAIPMVGVLDMLKYHKGSCGNGWNADYLNSEGGKEAFEYLLGYSPVHNVKENVAYPATMVTCADHDDRVVPSNSYKFIANLQKKSLNAKNPTEYTTQPVLCRIDLDAGHGAGKSITQLAQEHADIQSFALFGMGRSIE